MEGFTVVSDEGLKECVMTLERTKRALKAEE
jgi:hypothetical protein